MRLTIALFSLLLVSAPVVAQAPNLEELCREPYSHGISNHYDNLSETDQYTYYRNSIIDLHSKSYSSFKSSAGSIGLSVPLADKILGLSGTDNQKESQFQTQYDKFQSATQDQTEFRSRFSQHITEVSKDLTNSFNHCLDVVKDVILGQSGIIVTVDPATSVLDEFLVSVTIRQNNASKPKINGIYPASQVHCTSGGQPAIVGTKFDNYQFVLDCTKDPSKEVTFKIQVSGFTSQAITVHSNQSKLDELSEQMKDLRSQLTTLQNLPHPRLDVVSTPSGAGGKCQYVGESQVCWGETATSSDRNAGANANFTFPVAFAEPPMVMVSVTADAPNPGDYSYSVFSRSVDATSLNVQALESRGRADQSARVTVTYYALGKPIAAGASAVSPKQ